MNGLMLHCGAQNTSYDDLKSLSVPEATDTYVPVPHTDLIDIVTERSQKILGLQLKNLSLGVGKKGQQLFGVMTYDVPDDTQHGLSIGFRNSYDRSLSVGIAIGAHVFVCDNLAFSGDDLTILRRHTQNVWKDLLEKVDVTLERAPAAYKKLQELFNDMKQVDVTMREGYEMLGHAFGNQVLTARQATTAFSAWRNEQYMNDFGRNVWGLYNCLTEAMKKGEVGDTINRLVSAHTFMMDYLN